MMTSSRKNLDRWARDAGYADFDTYIRTGGSIRDAAHDIRVRVSRLVSALNAIDGQTAAKPNEAPPAEALILEHDPTPDDEPPDPANAHIQGAEHES